MAKQAVSVGRANVLINHTTFHHGQMEVRMMCLYRPIIPATLRTPSLYRMLYPQRVFKCVL